MNLKQAVTYTLQKYKKAYEMLADYDKGKRRPVSKKIKNYFDLPKKDKKRMVEEAARRSSEMMRKSLLESEELMKITPIRRKGCKNAGWIWDENNLNKLVVPLHPNKPFRYISSMYEMENIYFGKDGSLKKLNYEIDYSKILRNR